MKRAAGRVNKSRKTPQTPVPVKRAILSFTARDVEIAMANAAASYKGIDPIAQRNLMLIAAANVRKIL